MIHLRANKKAKAILALCLSIAMANSMLPDASACTRLLYETGNSSFVTGGSMDWMNPDAQTALWVFPRGMKRDGEVGKNQKTIRIDRGNPLGGEPSEKLKAAEPFNWLGAK